MSFALISRGYAANELLCGIGQRGGSCISAVSSKSVADSENRDKSR